MTIDDKILLFLNPLFLFYAASTIVKFVVLLNIVLALVGGAIFFVKLVQGRRSQHSKALDVLTWMAAAISGIGIVYVAYVFFLVIEPGLRAEPLQWLVSGGDLLITIEAGLLTALVGILGNRILQRDK